MPGKLNVFLTGATGRVGRVLLGPFEEAYDLKALYRRPVPEKQNAVLGDLSDKDLLRGAMEGVDVLVHLAAVAHERPFIGELVPANVIGAYNVFQAAHEAGVRRIVYASSCNAVPWESANRTIEVDDPYQPESLYGATKAFGEVLGRYYHGRLGMEFVAVRIGWLLPYEEDELRTSRRKRGIWLSPRDAVQLFRQAIEKPGLGYVLVFGTSITEPEVLSLRAARELLDYEPQDSVVELYGSRPEDRFPGAPGHGQESQTQEGET
ncbi:MAG: NAD-dependent epimerase/dehydratase family protein [Planctomycetota bacterium]|jgi:uronate dehydrogenase